jgi:hypothetical protein
LKNETRAGLRGRFCLGSKKKESRAGRGNPGAVKQFWGMKTIATIRRGDDRMRDSYNDGAGKTQSVELTGPVIAITSDGRCRVLWPGAILIEREQASAMFDALSRNKRHIKPLLGVVRDYACKLLLVWQNVAPFELPREPWIVLFGDDLFSAEGPEAFHAASVAAAFKAAGAFVVVASGPELDAYKHAATYAARERLNVVLIETLPEQEQAWIDRIEALRGPAEDFPVLVWRVFPKAQP